MAQCAASGCTSIRVPRRNLAEAQLGGEVKYVAVLVAIGVKQDGYREILGVAERTKEDLESWRGLITSQSVRTFEKQTCDLGLADERPFRVFQLAKTRRLPMEGKADGTGLTVFESKGGTPLVEYVYDGGHMPPSDAFEKIADFLK